jgi:DNA-binding XRE family transcriptional regulator
MSKFSQHLKVQRRRIGLGQDDVAALIGDCTHSRISRFERGWRLPPLEVALAYHVIFDIPVTDMFADVYASVKKHVRRRVRELMLRSPRNPVLAQRRKRSLEKLLKR